MTKKKLINETDGPWQIIIEQFFRYLIECFLFKHAQRIDWEKRYTPLKGEFPNPEGKQICDILYKVTLKDGEEEFIMIHLEIQGQEQTDFEQRVMEYNWRIYKKHKKPVISTVILLDNNPKWRPKKFELQDPITGKTYFRFEFNMVKILDYQGKLQELGKKSKIVSFIVEAQLAIMKAKKKESLKKRAKLALAKKLFNSGLDREQISDLYRFIDWLIKLEPNTMKAYQQELQQISERESWQDWDPVYVSTAEQVARMEGHEEGLKKGHEEGLKKGHEEGLKKGHQEAKTESARTILEKLIAKRFNKKEGSRYKPTIEKANLKTLHRWIQRVLDAPSVDAIFRTS